MAEGGSKGDSEGKGVEEKVYTAEEVAKHNTRESCWLIIHGKVVDVTSYLDSHPGSEEPLLKAAGGDATEDFMDQDHSRAAKRQLEKLIIGSLEGYDPNAAKKGDACSLQ